MAVYDELLTVGNPKTRKGEKLGYLTGGLHLAPARLSGREVCPSRTPGCTIACLNLSGRGHMHQDSRIRKTQWLRSDRNGFMQALERCIVSLEQKGERDGMQTCVRLNVLSDLRWEKLAYKDVNGKRWPNLMARFRDVIFYDYTKIAERFFLPLPSNYDLTFSYAETDVNHVNAWDVLARGGRVAVVFRNALRPLALPRNWNLPSTWNRLPVVDADEHDLRFLDGQGVISGLRAKGLARTDTSGFVVDVMPA